jgi:predicted transglutaminase-like cysteine proteinase
MMRYLLILPLLTACATSPVYQTVHHVNATVNSRIAFVHDAEQYGLADKWVVNPAKGDCEDFALTKIAELQAQGIPARLAICRDEKPSHAVALVLDGGTTWVLDNRLPYPIEKGNYGCKRWMRDDSLERLERKRTM